jgi:tetratricopeptide (TPR) repeat protein
MLAGRPEQALEWARPLQDGSEAGDGVYLAARAALESEHPALLEELQERWEAGRSLSGRELVALGDLLGLAGRLEDSAKAYGDALDSGNAPDATYNQIAWTRLFLGELDDETERQARIGSEKTQGSAGLHTLAAVQAARGRVETALQSLRATLDARRDPALLSHDVYVLGLIAEAVGEPGEAGRYYTDALAAAEEEEERDTPLATSVLVRARLSELESE